MSSGNSVSNQGNVKEKPTLVLQKLVSEEADLKEEKKNLAVLIKNLRSKVRKEINNRKKNIKQLKAEVMNLNFSCEELTKSLKTAETK